MVLYSVSVSSRWGLTEWTYSQFTIQTNQLSGSLICYKNIINKRKQYKKTTLLEISTKVTLRLYVLLINFIVLYMVFILEIWQKEWNTYRFFRYYNRLPFFIFLFIYVFGCTESQLGPAEPNSLIRDQTGPMHWKQNLSHWTTREVPIDHLFFPFNFIAFYWNIVDLQYYINCGGI